MSVQVTSLKTLADLLGFEEPLPRVVEPLRDVKLGRLGEPKILFCLDVIGGSQEGGYIDGCDKSNCYQFHHWQLVNSFVYSSHHLITIPPPGWITAGHRHGVKVLGTFTVESDLGIRILNKIREGNLVSIVASKVAHIAHSCKFDGWLINIKMDESNGPFLMKFLRAVTEETHRFVSGSLVIWYDSVLLDSTLDLHNELNEKNSGFFDLCDGISIYSNWTEEALQRSARCAGSRKSDVYVGINIFASKMKHSSGYEEVKAVEAARRHGLSSAIFDAGRVCTTKDEKESAGNQCRLWDFLECCCPQWCVRTLPLRTSFCRGYGEKLFEAGKVVSSMAWSDLSQQQLQPRDQGRSLCDGCGAAEVCTEQAYSGGSCLLLRFTPDAAKPRASPYFRLFTCDIPFGCLSVSYTYQMYPGCSKKVDVTLVLVVRLASGKKRKLLLGVNILLPEGEGCEAVRDFSCSPDAAISGWQTRRFRVKDVSSVPVAVLEEVSISFLSFGSSMAGACLLGELFIERTADKTGDQPAESSSSDEGSLILDCKHVTSPEQSPCDGRRPVHTYVTVHTIEENDEGEPKSRKLHRFIHCDKGFVEDLRKPFHTHTGSSRCDQCSRESARNLQLTRHMCTHTGEHPHRCEYCSHSFLRRQHLVSHLRTHTGERLYHCEYCGLTFSQRAHLTTHLQIHTSRPFQREFCSCDFSHKGHLRVHLQRMHEGSA